MESQWRDSVEALHEHDCSDSLGVGSRLQGICTVQYSTKYIRNTFKILTLKPEIIQFKVSCHKMSNIEKKMPPDVYRTV